MEKIKKKRTALGRIAYPFLTTLLGGITVILPLALLFAVFRFSWNFIVGLLRPMRGLFRFTGDLEIWVIDLVSFSLIITVFFFVGLFVRTRIGGNIFRTIERNTLENIPLYTTLRDIVNQFLGKKESSFLQVVLVKVFSSDTLMTGFVTEIINEELYTVFVPTGPNPTNGFIFHVRKDQLEFVDTKPEDAMRTIIGVGTGSSILFK